MNSPAYRAYLKKKSEEAYRNCTSYKMIYVPKEHRYLRFCETVPENSENRRWSKMWHLLLDVDGVTEREGKAFYRLDGLTLDSLSPYERAHFMRKLSGYVKGSGGK